MTVPSPAQPQVDIPRLGPSTSRVIPVDPFDLVTFGATGDLAFRKILPALYRRDQAGQLPDQARLIGAARRPLDASAYRDRARSALASHIPNAEIDPESLRRFLARIEYVSLDATGHRGWESLGALLRERRGTVRAFYLALDPHLVGETVARIAGEGFTGDGARVVIEKPIGRDRATAMAVNAAIGAHFPERRVFRIDHYLGKETVQNLMALRFANALFEPLWNSTWIDHVQITVAETIGVEGRGAYYDGAGALRDMVQNHLLQLLCLVAMEPPDRLDADGIRDEKLKVLRALAPLRGEDARRSTVRGQYGAGADGKGYAEDVGGAASAAETFVALRADVRNWRWAGAPFYLRTGKRMHARLSEIVIQFRPIPHSIFADDAGEIHANRLVLRLQPDEGMRLEIMIKDPGPGGMRLRHVPLDMTFAESFGTDHPDAYERLLLDVVRGNQTLFMRRDEVEAAWAWIDPVRAAWDQAEGGPDPYPAGEWGPAAARELLRRDGRLWREETSW